MKAIIIYFSPTGNTKKVAKKFAKLMSEKFEKVEIINLTRNESYWSSVSFRNNLYRIINNYDVLLIGSPVYAHHLHYNVKDFMKGLYPAENKEQIAIPFITYGGINSGEALHEAEVLLKTAGRKVVAGIKINAEHSLAKCMNISYNEGLPDDTFVPLFNEVIEKIISAKYNGRFEKDFLAYQKLPVRIRTKLLIGEKFWHRHMYPKHQFDYSKCGGCGICAKICPLLRIVMKEGKPVVKEDAKDCIHCGSCVHYCKTGGSYFDADMEKWKKLFIKSANGKGPLPSNEEPKTKVYSPLMEEQ